MALLRVRTVEALRRGCPGEFGRVPGLDRVPEVRCLRERLEAVASNAAAVVVWANALSKAWMKADPGMAGTLYVDGHVRVYHGGETELPRRYVASHRLCLRGVTDYWVNDPGLWRRSAVRRAAAVGPVASGRPLHPAAAPGSIRMPVRKP